MRFGNLQALWFLLLIPLATVFYFWAFRKKRGALTGFGGSDLMGKLTSATSWVRQGAKATLMVTGLFFLVLALTQPKAGMKMELLHRRGVDVMIALDTSMSMLAEDIRPNRIRRALFEIEAFIDHLEGDRVGLVLFAGRSFTLCPLTLDYGAAKLLLDGVDTNTIPVKGTAIADAIRTASRAFGSEERKYKVIVLITDGEDHAGDPVAAAEEAADAGVRIFAVGVGTRDGELIPVREGGRVDYMKDRQGNYVKTRLDEATLAKMASLTDGAYIRPQTGSVGLRQVHQQISEMEKKDLGSRKYTQYKDRFQWPLVLAFGCFFVEALMSDRRKSVGEWRGRFQT